jgi:hypothetical protein
MPRDAFKIFTKLAVAKGFQINLLLGFPAYQIIGAEATIDVKFLTIDRYDRKKNIIIHA